MKRRRTEPWGFVKVHIHILYPAHVTLECAHTIRNAHASTIWNPHLVSVTLSLENSNLRCSFYLFRLLAEYRFNRFKLLRSARTFRALFSDVPSSRNLLFIYAKIVNFLPHSYISLCHQDHSEIIVFSLTVHSFWYCLNRSSLSKSLGKENIRCRRLLIFLLFLQDF